LIYKNVNFKIQVQKIKVGKNTKFLICSEFVKKMLPREDYDYNYDHDYDYNYNYDHDYNWLWIVAGHGRRWTPSLGGPGGDYIKAEL
jgi:hypothetical protein